MQNKQTNPQKLRIFKNVITVFFFLRVVIFSMGSSILRKKLLWPWIFHSGSSRSLWGPTYDTSFLFTLLPVQPSRSLFLQSVKDAKEKGGRKGGRGGKKGQRKFPPGFFSCLRFLKFYGPDYLGAWSVPARRREGWVQRSSLNSLTWRCPCIFDQLPRTLHCQVSRTWRKWGTLVRVKKGRIFGTIYSCQSNRRGKLLISRLSIHSREKLDLEFWYMSWNHRSLGISLGHGTCCAWLVVWYDFCSCWILTPWMPSYGSHNLRSYQ